MKPDCSPDASASGLTDHFADGGGGGFNAGAVDIQVRDHSDPFGIDGDSEHLTL